MKKIGILYNKFESNVLMITLVIMVVIIFTNVVMRYIFNNSLSWSEELSRYMFVWFSWIGVSAGLKDGEHLRVELLKTKLLRNGLIKTNEAFALLISLVWFLTTLIVTYYGFELVSSQIKLQVVTPAMKMPMWFAYLSVPICSLIVAIRLIRDMVGSVKKMLKKSDYESEVTN